MIEYFRGIDLNNSPSNVDATRSPAAPNMIRDQIGKVRKRMGYRTVTTAPGRINGVHKLGDETLVHAGAKLYRWDGADDFEAIGEMANQKSRSFLFDEKLYLLDGTVFRVYDGKELKSVSENAYVPTTIISRPPGGGGTAHETINRLSRAWKESFLGTAEDKVYQLTTKELDADKVLVEVLNSSGEWVSKTEGTDFTVDRTEGKVTFNTAPGASPVNGMDNVRIMASKSREGHLDSINHCTIFEIYGAYGAADRVFLSGDPEKPGYDYYSGFADPTYFPDTAYSKISRDGSAVVGYAIINNALATFLDGAADGRNIVIRSGSLDNAGEAVFRISNTLIGESAVAKDSFAFCGKEPVFLTNKGVFAVTAEELTGEKYSQERSYYIGSALQEAADKAAAVSTVYRDFYVLAVGGGLYLLDLQQKTYEKNSPYSSYQYECYHWPGIAACCLWVDGEALCFGTEDGKLCRFATNVDDPASYNDDGAAIDAYWETSDFDGNAFFHSKTFTGISCRLAAAVQTGVKIYAQKRGIWSQVFDAKDRARYFDWGYIDYGKFVFSADRTPHTLFGKIKVKKVDKVRFRLQNGEVNEPFGLYAFGVEWREPGGNYKR